VVLVVATLVGDVVVAVSTLPAELSVDEIVVLAVAAVATVSVLFAFVLARDKTAMPLPRARRLTAPAAPAARRAFRAGWGRLRRAGEVPAAGSSADEGVWLDGIGGVLRKGQRWVRANGSYSGDVGCAAPPGSGERYGGLLGYGEPARTGGAG